MIRAGLAVIVGLAAFVLAAAVLVLVFRGGNDRQQQSLTDEPDRVEVADIGDVAADGQGYEIVIPLDPDGDDTGYKLFAIRADGDGIRKLLPGPAEGDPADEIDPAWSPDGSTLAFSSNRDGDADIYLWDGSGQPYPITDRPDDERHEGGARWHPSGRLLSIHSRSAMHFDRGGGRSYFSLDTMEFQESVAFGNTLSHWSPDGSRIAGLALGQIRNPPNAMTSTMWLADGDGSNEAQVSDFPANSFPDWSLDSRQFVFAGDNMVFIVNRDGSGLRPITDPSLSARNARWSPDDATIAFAGVNPETGFAALYLTAPDGSGLRLLTEQRNEIDQLAWSPDGRQIAYVTGSEMAAGTPVLGEPVTTLHVINADGTDDREIASNVYPHAEPIWRPAGGSGERAAATVPATATLPAAGQEIELPEQVQTVQSGGATIRLVTAGTAPPMTLQQAMEIVATEFPWGLGGEWEGKPIAIRAWFGIGTLTDVATSTITNRPMWVLDYGNVLGIIPSRSPDDTSPLVIPNHNVYAVDAETGELWFAGSYLEAELELGPTPTVPAGYPSPTAGPPEEVAIPPLVARVESSSVSIEITQTTRQFPISSDDAFARLEDAYPKPKGQVAVNAYGSGLTTIVAPTWAIVNRPMYVFDYESRDVEEDACPREVEGFRIICHDIYAVDGVTGEVLALGRSRETHMK